MVPLDARLPRMNDVVLAHQGFITAYRSRGVPPRHILLVGHDDDRNAAVALDFANDLGVKFVSKRCGQYSDHRRSHGDPLGK